MTVKFLTSMLQPDLLVRLHAGELSLQERRARWYQKDGVDYADSKVIDFKFSTAGAAIIIDIEL